MPRKMPAVGKVALPVVDASAAEAENLRVQLLFSPERMQLLDELQRQIDAPTRKELFNNAISLLSWAVREVRRGRVIASVDEQSQRFSELHMPALDAVASRMAAPVEEARVIVRSPSGD